MRKSYAIHGEGQGWILLVFLIVIGFLVYAAPALDVPIEPTFRICP